MKTLISAFAVLSILIGYQTLLAQTNRVAMSETVLLKLLQDNQVTELDQVPALFPKSFLANFTIKHGMMVDGPRGHLAEADVAGLGQHSSPQAPRAFVFDPYTGFAVSYNGSPAQQGGQTLDTISFDFSQKTFRLAKIDFPLSEPGKASVNSQNCTLCHGPNNRPVFSMYPDWPRFYGSDNDELLLNEFPAADFVGADKLTLLRRDLQKRELTEFLKFKSEVVEAGHPRYAPLFDPEAYASHGFTVPNSEYFSYPYRSDVEQPGVDLNKSDVSRSFTRRAGLRFNLLYSRLHVQEVMKRIVSHKRFGEFAPFFVYNLMRCAPEHGSSTNVMKKWNDRVTAALTEVAADQEIEYTKWNPAELDETRRLSVTGHFALPSGGLTLRERGSLLDYGQNLALFGLKINDVDMRFTYHHPAYDPENAYQDLKPNQVMSVGYLAKSYFNAYNDGSTTMDEHLISNIMKELAKKDKTIAEFMKRRRDRTQRGLLDKYQGAEFEDRLKYDREFFAQMDSYSTWYSIPYPFKSGDKEDHNSFFNLHHRAPFNAYQETYDEGCKILEAKLTRK